MRGAILGLLLTLSALLGGTVPARAQLGTGDLPSGQPCYRGNSCDLGTGALTAAGIQTWPNATVKCDGVTDDATAMNAALAALPAGSTVVIGPGKSCLVDSENLTIPVATRVVGSGSPHGMMNAGLGYQSSSTLVLNPAHTIVFSPGSALEWMNVLRKGLVASPTSAQVKSDIAAWGADNSTGFLIPASNGGGAVVQHDFIMGFHWMGIALSADYTIENVQGDDYNGLFVNGGDYARIAYVRLEPWRCINSPNCGGGIDNAADARPGTAFYILGGPYLTEGGVEDWAEGYVLDGSAGGGAVQYSGTEWAADAFSGAGSGAPYNGFGVVGYRLIGESYTDSRNLFAHWNSINYQIDGSSTSMLLSGLQVSNVGNLNNDAGVAPIVFSGPGQSSTNVTIGGSASAGSTASVTVAGQTPPPNFVYLSDVSGGSISQTEYYVKLTYASSTTETTGGTEYSYAVPANYVLKVQSPPIWQGATGYNVYVSTSSGSETLQNSAPIAFGTNWTEPTSGLVSGASLPGSNTTAWTETVTYAVDQIPGLTDSLGTTAEFLENLINTDPVLVGNHVWASFGGDVITVSAPSVFPAITVTAASTGGLTTATGSGSAPASPSGAIDGIIVGGASSSYPILSQLNGGSWQVSNVDYSNGKLWANWFIGASATFTGLTGIISNVNPAVSGTGCSAVALRDSGGTILETSSSTGCTVTFGTPYPFAPVCSVQGYGATQPSSVTAATTTSFAWSNTAPSGNQQFGVRCATIY